MSDTALTLRPEAGIAREGPTPMMLLQDAIARGLKTEDLERLAALQERWEERQAAKAFGEALAHFQALCPVIKKRRKAVIPGKFAYSYASYDDIHLAVRALLADCGLTVSFDTASDGGGVKVTCHVRLGTHVQSTAFVVPAPQLSTNNTQSFGAALSYGKRYALCAALNIVASDEDDDGASLIEKINADQVDVICRLLAETGRDERRFCAWAGVNEIGEIAVGRYHEAVDMLTRKPATGRSLGTKGGAK